VTHSNTHFNYENAPYAIRDDLKQAYRAQWQAMARPGNWWTGAERVAIAQEARNAVRCGYCEERKLALSPYNFPGEHQHSTALDPLAVDAVHRIITDQSRITQAWIEENAKQGLSTEKYVELLGITVTTFSIDEFNRALGLPLEPLPEPEAGEPDHYRPERAVSGAGYVPMLPSKGGALGDESDLWQDGRGPNVVRALSLVPEAVRNWRDLSGAQYLSFQGMSNFSGDTGRSINRMQMEIIAGRVSAINECFY
jgi:hypothetical protein